MKNLNYAIAEFQEKYESITPADMQTFILGYQACAAIMASDANNNHDDATIVLSNINKKELVDEAYSISIAAEDTAYADYDADYKGRFIQD